MRLPLCTSGETEDRGLQGRFAAHPSWLQTEARCLQNRATEMEPRLKSVGAAGDANPDLSSHRPQPSAPGKTSVQNGHGDFQPEFQPAHVGAGCRIINLRWINARRDLSGSFLVRSLARSPSRLPGVCQAHSNPLENTLRCLKNINPWT